MQELEKQMARVELYTKNIRRLCQRAISRATNPQPNGEEDDDASDTSSLFSLASSSAASSCAETPRRGGRAMAKPPQQRRHHHSMESILRNLDSKSRTLSESLRRVKILLSSSPDISTAERQAPQFKMLQKHFFEELAEPAHLAIEEARVVRRNGGVFTVSPPPPQDQQELRDGPPPRSDIPPPAAASTTTTTSTQDESKNWSVWNWLRGNTEPPPTAATDDDDTTNTIVATNKEDMQRQVCKEMQQILEIQYDEEKEKLETQKRLREIANDAREVAEIQAQINALTLEQEQKLAEAETKAAKAVEVTVNARKQLTAAARSKLAFMCLGGAVVGGLVAGPVGVYAGAKTAGTITACVLAGGTTGAVATKKVSDVIKSTHKKMTIEADEHTQQAPLLTSKTTKPDPAARKKDE